MGGGYEEVGSASGVTNVNPYTGDIMQLLQQQLGAGNEGASSLINQMLSGDGGGFDFLNVLDDERLTGAIGGYADARGSLARQAATNAEQSIAGKYAGTGIYSGAFGQALGLGVGEAYTRGAVDIEGQKLGLFNTAMGLAGQERGQALGYYGNQANTALQGLSGFGRPEFYNPTYAYNPGIFGDIASGLGVAGSAAMTGLGVQQLFG